MKPTKWIMLALLLLPVAAHATSPGTGFSIPNPLGDTENLEDLISSLATRIQELAVPVAVVMILWAGFNFLTAAGNPGKITRAKQILLYTAIGLAVIFIGGGFVSLVKSILNLGGSTGTNGSVQTLPVGSQQPALYNPQR